MARNEKQKQSLYFPEDMLREIMKESVRIDRSLSWTVQQAWRLAREQVRSFPSLHSRGEADPARDADESVEREHRPSPQVLAFLKGKFENELTS